MNLKFLFTSCALELAGRSLAFPTTVDEFYEVLRKRLTPRPSDGVDACKKIAGKPVVRYQKAIDCYNEFPLKAKVRRETLYSLKKTLELYAFKAIVTKSPEPKIPSCREIDNELSQISKYDFGSEFEFNSFLTGYFNSYLDGHTIYHSKCYSKLTFRQFFLIYMVCNEIKIAEGLSNYDKFTEEWWRLGVNIIKYQGSQVLKINGMNPLKYLKKYSNFNVGQSRDINSRLNLIFAKNLFTNGDQDIDPGLFTYTNLVPLTSYVTCLLKTPGGKINEVKAPYLVKSPGNFQGYKSYYKNYCQPNIKFNYETYGRKQEVGKMKDVPVHQVSYKSQRFKRNIDVKQLLARKSLVAYLIENDIGVLIISSFELEGDDWYYGIDHAFKAFKLNKVKKLILDLSNNNGSIVCRGYDILFGLFPNSKQALNDIRSSPLQTELSRIKTFNGYSPLIYNKPNGDPFNNHQAFTNKRLHPRGNKIQAEFTPKFLNHCLQLKNLLPITFKPDDIAIVTNTIYYYTCALVNSLQELYNITTYAVGGDPSLPAPLASMLGGSPIEFNDPISLIKDANLTKHPSAPIPLPAHVTFTVLVIESYSHHHPNRPLEFTFLPAQYRLNYTSDSNYGPTNIWNHIAKQMKKSKSSKLKSNSKKNSQKYSKQEKNKK